MRSALLSSKKKTIGLLNRGADILLSAEAPDQDWEVRLGAAPLIYSREINYWLFAAARDMAGARHVQSVKGHVQGLSAKAYWDQFESSPDFVAMFVPLDSALAAALERAPDLMTEAMDRRVVIVTPTTLFALCKAVVYGWRVEE